jgi:D-alanyl-D-alanine carboxypeptidase
MRLSLIPTLFVALFFSSPAFASDDLVARLDAILAQTYRSGEPGAVVLIVQGDRTLLRKGYGLADVELGVPLTPDHRLKVGSISKQFTAVAALQLVEQGKLSLDDPLSKYLAGFNEKAAGVTIRQLLTHSSGLGNYLADPGYHANLRQDTTTAEIVSLIASLPMEFDPGSRFAYSNSGYFVLGALIEKITGRPLAEVLREDVFRPAGLKETFVDSIPEIIPRRASGYDRREGKLRNATLYSPTRAQGVGDIVTTVDDLRRWNDAVSTAQVGRRDFLEEARRDLSVAGKPSGYGYGWFIGTLEGEGVIEHGGDIPGFSAHVLTIPSKKIFVAVLSNDAHHDPRPDFVANQLATFLIGKPWDPKPVALGAKRIAELTGVYANEAGARWTVTSEGERLFIQRTGGPKFEIQAMADGRLFYPRTFRTIRVEEGDGKARALVFQMKGSEIARGVRVE